MSQPKDSSKSGAEPPPPFSIPEHTLIRRIGRGGIGEVWLARNTLGAYRAVKIVQAIGGRREKLQSELAGILKFEPVSRFHDGLVDILQAGGGEKAGYLYYVMELADCIHSGQAINPGTYAPRTLAEEIRRRGRLPVEECVRLGAVIASALGFLHRQDLIHRDLKPSNIIFINGFPKLADVGLMTDINVEREYVGTEGFIAPEGAGTAKADLYSLGKVLYEMSTGQQATEYPTLPANLGASREDQALVQFSQIVVKACRTKSRLRYRSTDELMMALLGFQFTRKISRWGSGGRPWIWLISVIGATLGAGFIIFLVWRLVTVLRETP